MNEKAKTKPPPPLATCPFCNRDGLPILPVRYAVARTDLGSTPSLPKNFIEDPISSFVKDLDHIKLPGKIARYTLRLLRPGYLYMYDEHRKEWSGYVVNAQSYLYKFFEFSESVMAGKYFSVPQPSVAVDAIDLSKHANCRGKNFPYIMRCVTVKAAASATTVWLGFSDAPWTTAVLKQHMDSAGRKGLPYREAHMQRIDMAGWRNGHAQPHMLPFSSLNHDVAEFAANRATLHQQTRDYLPRFLPQKHKIVMETRTQPTPNASQAPGGIGVGPGFSALFGKKKPDPNFTKIKVPADTGEMEPSKIEDVVADPKLKDSLAPQFQELLPCAVNQNTHNPVKTAAWAFSPFDLWLVEQQETQSMQRWGAQLEEGYRKKPETVHLRPAIAGVPDPASIVMELNGLALHRSIEFLSDADWIWKYETLGAIDALHNAFLNGAVQEDIQTTRILRGIQGATGESSDRWLPESDAEKTGQLPPQEKKQKEIEWKTDYLEKCLKDKGKVLDNFKKQYPEHLDGPNKEVVSPLDRVYVDWFQSQTLQIYFTHNFDPADPTNGRHYQQVVYNCIAQASSRAGALACFKDALNRDPTLSNIIARSLVFNQDALAQKWTEAAGASLRETDEKFYKAVEDTFIHNSLGEKMEGPLSSLASHLYQLAGPVTAHLGDMLNAGGDWAVRKLPERRLISVMMGVVNSQKPNLELITVSSELTDERAGRVLLDAITEVSGGKKKSIAKDARKMAREAQKSVQAAATNAKNAAGKKKYKVRGLFLIDRNSAAKIGATNLERLNTIKAVDFQEQIKVSARTILHPEIKGSVICALFSLASMFYSFGEIKKDDNTLFQAMKFGASVIAFAGDTMEVSGQILYRAAPKTQTRVGVFLDNYIKIREFNGLKLVKFGKIVGAVGGAIAGGLDIWTGIGALKYDRAYGYTMITLGGGEMLSAGIIVVSEMAGIETLGPIGLVLGILIATASYCIGEFLAPKPIQEWLLSCKFGNLTKDSLFRSLTEQQAKLEQLI